MPDALNQVERITGCLAKRGIVEDAPVFLRALGDTPSRMIQVFRRIPGIIHPRRPMQPAVGQARPAARNSRPSHRRRVDRDTRDQQPRQQAVHAIGEPGWMSRLADDGAIKPGTKQVEKPADDRFLEAPARWQLHQKRAKRVAERPDFRQEAIQDVCYRNELSDMGDLARDLGGETETRRHRRRPARISSDPVRPVKTGIDFDRRKSPRIAREVTALAWKVSRVWLRDAPPGGADPDHKPRGYSFTAPVIEDT